MLECVFHLEMTKLTARPAAAAGSDWDVTLEGEKWVEGEQVGVETFTLRASNVVLGMLLFLASGAGEDLHEAQQHGEFVEAAYAAIEPLLDGCPESCRPIP